jgi:hypothetical protein
MIAVWQVLASDTSLDAFHCINEPGLLAITDWIAIAREVWGSDH